MSNASKRAFITVQPPGDGSLSKSPADDLSAAVEADLQRIFAKRHYSAAEAPSRVGMPQPDEAPSTHAQVAEARLAQSKMSDRRGRFGSGPLATLGILVVAGAFGFVMGAFALPLPDIFASRVGAERTFRLPAGLGAGDRLAAEGRRAAPVAGQELASRPAGSTN